MFLPWYLFLFAGAIDFGFYTYSLIGVQNAVRVSSIYCSRSASTATDSTTACSYALDQLRNLPNIGSSMSTCSSPLTVTTQEVTGPDGSMASSVTVTYQTPQLIPIPGLLPGQLTVSRTAVARLKT
jgi:hypothetical protein